MANPLRAPQRQNAQPAILGRSGLAHASHAPFEQAAYGMGQSQIAPRAKMKQEIEDCKYSKISDGFIY
jgi:hypothetical protein